MKNKISFLLPLMLFSLVFAGCKDDGTAIVRRYQQFLGGKERWSQIKTIKTAGEYDYGGIKFPFTSVSKAPDSYKFVVPFNGKYYAQGYDGATGWKIDAFKNETHPTLLTGTQAKELANEADVALESLLMRDDQAMTLLGDTSITTSYPDSATTTIKIKKMMIRKADGADEFFYFDEKTGALVLKKSRARNSELKKAWLTTSFSDYRTIEGIKIPFKEVHEAGGQMVLTITLDKVIVNEAVDDKEFQP